MAGPFQGVLRAFDGHGPDQRRMQGGNASKHRCKGYVRRIPAGAGR
jgi:hypothetical protein